jgi:hypothetical protein
MLLHKNNFIYKIFIYTIFNSKLVKGQLESDEKLLDNSSVPYYPKLLNLKIKITKIPKFQNSKIK